VVQVDAKDAVDKVHEKIVRIVEERLFTAAPKAGPRARD
jgi:hypothetical protein